MAEHANGPYPAEGQPAQRKEIYTYKAPWTVFAMAWSRRLVLL